VGPAQFGTQCVPNWKCLKESPHIAQIPLIKTLAEFRCQFPSQAAEKMRAVFCSGCTALLKFNNMPSHFPSCAHLYNINRAQRLPVCLLYKAAQFTQQRIKSGAFKWQG